MDAFSEMRWLGGQVGGPVWEVDEEAGQSLDLDVDKLDIRLRDSKAPLVRVSDHPLQFQTPPGARGGHFVVEYDGTHYPFTSRQIPLEGSPNCRDLGGYPGADEKHVVWRQLFRSGHWHNLSEDDVRYVQHLNLALICDFRSEDEQLRHPPKLPKPNRIEHISLPIKPGSVSSFFEHLREKSQEQGNYDIHRVMCEVNRELVIEHAAQYQKMFESILAQKKNGAIMINCTAGKDRTGLGAALILLALGVPVETVIADYLKTRHYAEKHVAKLMRDYVERRNMDTDVIKPILSVREDYIQSALDTIRERYGTVDNYLREIGVNDEARAELRSRFLA